MIKVPSRMGSWNGIASQLSRPKISFVRFIWSCMVSSSSFQG
jgi:hypothetical protein